MAKVKGLDIRATGRKLGVYEVSKYAG
ncbi:hypothetical protein LCGC14_1816660, partial [marine sediment metagenome]